MANLSEWQESAVQVEAAADVALAHSRAVLDLASLRLEEVGDRWYPAAGTPWYVAVFGRDALITSLQALTANLPFPIAVLERLAQLQGRKVDRFSGEEPGRMPHERRHDELTVLGKLPYTPYYGTVDASLLYVILLHELYRFTADRAVLVYIP